MKNKRNIAARAARFVCATCLLVFGASWLIAPAHAQQTFSIGGTTKDSTTGAPLPDVTVTLTGTLSRTVQTNSAGQFSFTGLTAGGDYDVTPSKPGYVFNPSSFGVSNIGGDFTVTFNGVLVASASIQFSAPNFTFNEGTVTDASVGATDATITVTRTGDTSAAASVDFVTVDDPAAVRCDDTTTKPNVAFARCDYATTVDRLTFAAGQTQKTIIIPLINDAHVEPAETVLLRLTNAAGAGLGTQTTATLTITDNDAPGAANPINGSPFFVRMQYLDFLSREPDLGGFNAWVNLLNGCSDVNNNPSCDRILVSQSFFGSQEFQLKGFFVFRFYKLAFNRLPTYAEIVVDMRAVTGQTADEVFQKKAQFANSFTQRAEFTGTYNAQSNGAYVAALMGRYGLTQISTPDPAAPDGTQKVTLTSTDLTNRLNAGTLTRAQVLRAIADSDQVFQAELNGAFVAMQYFGYLRRDPDPAGYQAWLNYLNANPTDSRTMINGFVNSFEYRLRFGNPNN